MMNTDLWELVRKDIIGNDAVIGTPFGKRLLTYADYTASGRGVFFIERYIQRILRHYANTHTEDDATGMMTTSRLHKAEATIKRLVNAGPQYKIIEAGSGTTGAVHRLQQILGVYLPPVAKEMLPKLIENFLAKKTYDALLEDLHAHRPVVFVGPYEHHSNEVSWRECFTEVVEIELDDEGLLDCNDLENKLSDPAYRGRRLIGAFSAASNVSGVKTPVYEVARRLHRHGALAFFDFAASAPYAKIDMCLDEQSYFDGVYFSPHKFLGGPGSSGVLIIHQDVYRKDLPPTVGAGGTVDYVSSSEQAYNTDIEAREKPGTPGILQIMRTALAMELKERIGIERIASRENELIRKAMDKFTRCSHIEIMGNRDPEKRLPIFSFNIKTDDSYLHPRFVTILLNDLFGIQSRAGCSCAGPYGHRILHIDGQKSLLFKDRLAHGFCGLKPGWIRMNFHYLMTDADFEFIMAGICFVCEFGKYFLPLYEFDIHTGNWRHRTYQYPKTSFGLQDALSSLPGSETACRTPAGEKTRETQYEKYLAEANAIAEELESSFNTHKLKTTERDLIPFIYI
jgi:selenocysteine lyase/cysteine desulfurase